MRSRIYVVVALVAACLAVPSPALAHRHAHPARVEQPTSVELLSAMLTAADEWWGLQGSPPPCAGRADVQWGTVDDVHQAFAFYHSCTLVLAPHWWATQYAFLTSGRSLRARRRAAALDLALLMHERGHNIGYRHLPGTVMAPDAPVVPGWAAEWATRTIR